jgi:predicted TPR repeat methyltransferase
MKPIRYSVSSGIRLAAVDDGYIAYDSDHDSVHHLNPTAALILELCNGRRFPEEIAAILARTLADPCSGTEEIGAWLSEAADRGLLTADPFSPAEATEIDGETLARLATSLRDEGEIRKAFLCQQRAAELAGEDPEMWRSLGELAHIEGDRAAACRAYGRYLELEPDDAEVSHILVALSDESPPPRASDESVLCLYERFSGFYDESMRDELEYRAPELLMEALDQVMPFDPGGLDVLDLGCGTGLAGPLVRPWARRLDGVDISPPMIARSRERRCYDRLDTAELGEWLSSTERIYDLVLACDVFVYFGDLTAVFKSVERIVAPDGFFGFTVEKGASGGVTLTDSGRYTHDRRHIDAAAAGAGLHVAHSGERTLRMEYGDPVTGIVTVLCRGSV